MTRQPDTRDIAFSMAIISMVNGARDNDLIKSRDEGIMCCLTAAISFAIDTAHPGSEEEAISKVEAILDDLTPAYRIAVSDGNCQGKAGGFRRS